MHKHAELPLFVEIGEGAVEVVSILVKDLRAENIVMLSGKTSYKIAGKIVEESTNLTYTYILENRDVVRKLIAKLSYGDADCIIAVGGGRIIDSGKLLASELNVPLVTVPTTASHDGMASPVASFRNGEVFSIFTKPPSAVVADTSIISRSPSRLTRAGFGDLVSNITAVKDWKLSKEIDPTDYSEIAASIAYMPAKMAIEKTPTVEDLVRGLVMSGVAMSIAGSSRPASGAEHKFSHSLDILGIGRALHGEQVGIGTIIMEYFHEVTYGGDWEKIKGAMESFGCVTKLRDVGISKKDALTALMNAKKIRPSRYTILDAVNPSREDFERALNVTGVC